MYSRKVDGKILTFGVSGKLWRNSLVMYDRETRSLWSHITGEAMAGPLKGEVLEPIAGTPRIQWKEWKRQHPNTKVLSVKGRQDASNNYGGYHASSAIGIHREQAKDQRVMPKVQVIGVTVGKAAKAYRLSSFAGRSVLADSIGGKPLLVFHDVESGATAVYEAVIGDQLVQPVEKTAGFVAKDRRGNRWNFLTGVAIEGSMRDKVLKRVTHFQVYWFAWSDFHPQTKIYSQSANP